MNLLRVKFRKFSKNLPYLKKDFYTSLSISIIIHLFVLYCIFSIPSVQPLNMESIEVDFTMAADIGKSGNASKNGKGRIVNDKLEKKTFETQQTKNRKWATAENKTRSKDDLASNKQHAAKDSTDSVEKDINNIPTDIVSLNVFKSNQSDHGSQTITGIYKGGKAGKGASDYNEGTEEGGGFGLPGQGGEGAAYDFGYIRQTIMRNLQYPEKARRFGWEGKVILHFIINETGLVRDIKIVKSSGVQTLDNAAKDALLKVAAFRNKNNRLVVVQLPIEFKLKQ